MNKTQSIGRQLIQCSDLFEQYSTACERIRVLIDLFDNLKLDDKTRAGIGKHLEQQAIQLSNAIGYATHDMSKLIYQEIQQLATDKESLNA